MIFLRRYIPFVLLVLFALSCAKKKYPESVIENQPVHYSKFDVNGKTVELRAGEGYYMFTDKEKDSLNVETFTGHLRPLSCTNCGPALKIGIRDVSTADKPVSAPVDTTILARSYQYLAPYLGNSFRAAFSGDFNRGVSDMAFNWDFGDGDTAVGRYPVHVYKRPGSYKVCLTVKGQDNCISSICNVQRIEPDKFNVNISAQQDSSSLFHFVAAASGGSPPYYYSWDFGDLSVSNQPDPYHQYKYTGSYGVKLKVTDSKGQFLLASYNAVTKKDLSSCAANFQRADLSMVSGIASTLNRIILYYTDEHGITYRSDLREQPADAQFIVTSVSEGEINEKGQRTKKLGIRFNCEVYNGSQKLSITNGISVISVGYK